MEIITAFIAGLLAMAAAVIAWRLKQIDDKSARKHSILSEKRAILSPVYKDTHILFQKVVAATLRNESGSVLDGFMDISARIHLWAPEHIRNSFESAYDKWQKWAEIHLILIHGESRPENGNNSITTRRPESEINRENLEMAKSQFASTLRKLIFEMREDLEVNT